MLNAQVVVVVKSLYFMFRWPFLRSWSRIRFNQNWNRPSILLMKTLQHASRNRRQTNFYLGLSFLLKQFGLKWWTSFELIQNCFWSKILLTYFCCIDVWNEKSITWHWKDYVKWKNVLKLKNLCILSWSVLKIVFAPTRTTRWLSFSFFLFL